ncbi:MAG: hypothetical protein ACM3KM_00125 [Acidobacteriaceae bacterium]
MDIEVGTREWLEREIMNMLDGRQVSESEIVRTLILAPVTIRDLLNKMEENKKIVLIKEVDKDRVWQKSG